jgi:3-phosphoshikimate 1-carboxyvinyltransferase
LTTLVVHPATHPLVGSVPVPGDTEIALRAVAFAALGEGESHLTGLPRNRALEAIARCFRALGVRVDEASPSVWSVEGAGRAGLSAPAVALDCGDSLSSAAIFAGLLAGSHFGSTLAGSPSIVHAPLASLVGLLRLRGAVITSPSGAAGEAVRLPLSIGPLPGGRALSPLEHTSEVADAHVKTALLLSGLRAEGSTILREPSVSEDHTERMLAALHAPLRTIGPVIRVEPAESTGPWPAFRMTVPGDPSAAAYLVAAAQVVAGSRVTIRGVSTNPTRSGFLQMARDLGAGLQVEAHGEELGEPVADLVAWCAAPRGARLGGELVVRSGSALPAACVVAAVAAGTTRIYASELAAGDESGAMLAAMTVTLRAFGVECGPTGDGVAIHGRGPRVAPADVDSRDDARVAMAACALALAAAGPSRIRNAGCIASRFPKFVATLRALGAHIDVDAR